MNHPLVNPTPVGICKANTDWRGPPLTQILNPLKSEFGDSSTSTDLVSSFEIRSVLIVIIFEITDTTSKTGAGGASRVVSRCKGFEYSHMRLKKYTLKQRFLTRYVLLSKA